MEMSAMKGRNKWKGIGIYDCRVGAGSDLGNYFFAMRWKITCVRV